MDEEMAKILAELLSGLAETIERARGELVKYVEKGIMNWRVIESPRPVSPDDAAIKWLLRKFEMVRERHPNIRVEILKDSNGMITGLKYLAENDEEAADIESMSAWAFSKAASRPSGAKQEHGGETKK